jgi:HEXXH motif-containing protein
MKYHRMPPELFAALADGGGGAEATSILVAAQHSKHALLLQGVTRKAVAAGHPQASLAVRGHELLDKAQRKDAEAVAAVTRHPSVGAWAYRTLAGLGRTAPGAIAISAGTGAAMPGLLAGIAAAAALHAGISAEIEVPVIDGIVMLPTLGAAGPVEAGTATIRVSAYGAEVIGQTTRVRVPAAFRSAAPRWRPLRPVLTTPRFELVADDIDPFRMPAAPHVAPYAQLDGWPEMFRAAWALLRRHHPEVAAEVAAMIRVVVPLRRPAKGQVSSSSPETSGAIAMSDPVDPVALAVTIAHELQHVKLSALLDMMALVKPDDGTRFYASWRDDPRPASGLLQGTYAYLGVTAFWRRMLAEGAARSVPWIDGEFEFCRWRSAAARAAQTLLRSGRLTDAGQEFVSRMAATLAERAAEPVSERARARATEANARHLVAWQSAHGFG